MIRIKVGQGVFLIETPCEQNRERDLIELNASPIRCSIDPKILWKAAVGVLDRCEVDQRPQRRDCVTCRQQSQLRYSPCLLSRHSGNRLHRCLRATLPTVWTMKR